MLVSGMFVGGHLRRTRLLLAWRRRITCLSFAALLQTQCWPAPLWVLLHLPRFYYILCDHLTVHGKLVSVHLLAAEVVEDLGPLFMARTDGTEATGHRSLRGLEHEPLLSVFLFILNPEKISQGVFRSSHSF